MNRKNRYDDRSLLLEKVAYSIKTDDKRSGYKYMQEYESKYISNEDWLKENKYSYQQFHNTQEILELGKKYTDNLRFTQAFFIYKLILPAL